MFHNALGAVASSILCFWTSLVKMCAMAPTQVFCSVYVPAIIVYEIALRRICDVRLDVRLRFMSICTTKVLLRLTLW